MLYLPSPKYVNTCEKIFQTVQLTLKYHKKHNTKYMFLSLFQDVPRQSFDLGRARVPSLPVQTGLGNLLLQMICIAGVTSKKNAGNRP